MRAARRCLAATAIAVACLVPGVASAASNDVAAGGGSTASYQFGFGATGITSGTDGQDAHGAVNFNGLIAGVTANFNGKVTCLVETGNEARIGGSADIDLGAFGTYHGFMFAIQDNGDPVSGQSPDLISSLHVLPGSPDAACTEPAGGVVPEFPLTTGNVTVVNH